MNKPQIQTGIILMCLACLAGRASAQGWGLVWSDEFTQPDGSSPDPAKWTFETGGGGWGNNELEYYTSRTNNARIEGGQLVIEARQESYHGANYTSARLKTQNKAVWTYGRMEARIKIPRGQGIWPAFWMLGANIGSVGWPTCGETDIMENIGAEPSTVHGTIHGPGYSGGNGIGGPYTLAGGADYADDFHIYAIEWETNRIRWYMDNHQYFTATPANLGGKQWVFTQPQFLLLNVAVGGQWPGNPDGSTVFPQRMTVDYVRVYADTNNSTTVTNDAPTCGNVLPNPGFELGGLADWQTYGPNTYLQSINNLPVHSGSNVFKVYGQFTGSENYSGVYHDTAIAPEATYTAGGWAYTPANDQMAGGNTAWIEVSFRDAGENILSLYRSAVISSSSTVGVWLDLAVTNQLDPTTFATIGSVTNLAAPTGATFVRYQVVFRQPANAVGAMLFDDLNLASSLESAPVEASASLSNGSLNISFPTILGQPYQVRYKNLIGEIAWQVLTNLTGDGGTMSVADSLGASRRFYSVVRACN